MHFTRTLRADKKRPGLLYAGTEYGMYISYNDGTSWEKFQLNLPLVPVTDLTIKNNDLVVATQGRAFWVIDDDLSMVQQKENVLPAQNQKVFAVNDAYRTEGSGGSYRLKRKAIVHNAGDNPLNGVVFNYYLGHASDSAAFSITIFDKENKPIKTFSKTAKDASDKIDFSSGMNQFAWGHAVSAGRDGGRADTLEWRRRTVKAAPGKYKARFRFEKIPAMFLL